MTPLPETLPVSEPLAHSSKSPLQVAISTLLAAFPIPMVAYKLLPGDIGKKIADVTEGDPEQAHQFVTEIHARLEALLDADHEAGYGIHLDATGIGPDAMSGDDTLGQVNLDGRVDEVLPESVPTSSNPTDR